MESRIAIVSIIVENRDSADKVNDILHSYSDYIIGRLGLPYKKRNISIICIAMDAPNDVISALSGKLGMLRNVTSKAVYLKAFPLSDETKGLD